MTLELHHPHSVNKTSLIKGNGATANWVFGNSGEEQPSSADFMSLLLDGSTPTLRSLCMTGGEKPLKSLFTSLVQTLTSVLTVAV